MSPSSLYLAPFWPAVDIAVLEGGLERALATKVMLSSRSFGVTMTLHEGKSIRLITRRRSTGIARNAATMPQSPNGTCGLPSDAGISCWNEAGHRTREAIGFLWPGGGGRRAVLGHMSVLIRPAPSLSVDHRTSCSCTTDD